MTGFLGPNGAGTSTTMRPSPAWTGRPQGRCVSTASTIPNRPPPWSCSAAARLITETSVEDFADQAAVGVLVRTRKRRGSARCWRSGVTVIDDGTDLLHVSGTTAEQIGAAAWRAHLPVYELTPTHASLEEACPTARSRPACSCPKAP